MEKWEEAGWHPETLAIRAGVHTTPEGEHSEPIFPTSSYVFKNAAEAAARFAGEPGNVYSRYTNPTVRGFEERLAALEGADDCVATSSGMAACLAVFMSLLKAGDHVVASRAIFGTTVQMLGNILGRWGLESSFVDLTDPQAWRDAVRPNTRLFFLETPSNPMTEIADLAVLADIAHQHGAILVVDNTFCTPILQRPLDFGADVVIHSATKYIDGQGRCLGGAALGSTELMNAVRGFLRTSGPSMSPLNAWVFLKGLETLALRMEAHCRTAQSLADWLQEQAGVKQVFYPGLSTHPQYELALKQQKQFGAIISFDVEGGQNAAWAFMDALKICSISANLGDAKSIVTHAASTTHSRVSAEMRAVAGITDGLVRISVGLENIEDLKQDLACGLEAARRAGI